MNTKTDGISSGLLAAAWLSTDCIGERYLCFSKPRDNDPCETLVRLSGAEAIISAKDAEIERLIQFATLTDGGFNERMQTISQQAERIKELEGE